LGEGQFSAIEALVKIRNGSNPGQKDWSKLERILGVGLKTEIWGERGDPTNALRHRLVHGEYFNPQDSTKNYLELMHKKIIAYFNEAVSERRKVGLAQGSLFDRLTCAWF
jgi:hypothetical protein